MYTLMYFYLYTTISIQLFEDIEMNITGYEVAFNNFL